MCSHVVGEIIFLLFIWIEAFYLVTLKPQIGVFILMITGIYTLKVNINDSIISKKIIIK